MARLNAGDTAYIVESNRIITEVKVINCAGGMYLIKFPSGGGIRVKEHRLFATEDDTHRHHNPYKNPYQAYLPGLFQFHYFLLLHLKKLQ